MMNNRLELLIRKNNGRRKREICEGVLQKSGFAENDLTHIELEEVDEITHQLSDLYTKGEFFSEFIDGKSIDFQDSNLLKKIFHNLETDSYCFIYSDDCKDCGASLVKVKIAFENILNLAKNDYQNSCSIIDRYLKYLFWITYNDESHNDDPNTFDIQLRSKILT